MTCPATCPAQVFLPMPDPRRSIDVGDVSVIPCAVQRTARVTRVELPTPDAVVVLDGPHVVVLIDHRVDDRRAERLRQAAQLLADLPHQRDGQTPR